MTLPPSAIRLGVPRLRRRLTHRLNWIAALALLPAMLLTTGCRITIGGETTVSEENHRLRAENLALRRQIDELTNRVELRLGEVETLRQQLAAASQTPDPDEAATPTLARLAFGRHSGPVDLNGDGRHDIIRLYLRPQDQRGRLLPVAGRAFIRAVNIPEVGEPEVIAQRAYSPQEFDAAWRDAFTGSHFTLELPLPDALPSGSTELTIRVNFVQAGTGVRLSQQQTMLVQR